MSYAECHSPYLCDECLSRQEPGEEPGEVELQQSQLVS